jgi:hypothetical protein
VSAAVHGQSQGLVSNIRVVLSKLYEGKKLGGPGSVDSMLVRVYEPILFRALAAANPEVRKNALQVMLDVFPLVVSKPTPWQACVSRDVCYLHDGMVPGYLQRYQAW